MESKRRNIEILFNNTTVVPFKNWGQNRCFFCNKLFNNWKVFKEHSRVHRPCSHAMLKTCFPNGNAIYLDVSVIRCNLCLENFPNVQELGYHLYNNHDLEFDQDTSLKMIVFRLIDFKCVECDEKFQGLGGLSVHMNEKHKIPKQDDCGKIRKDFARTDGRKGKELQSKINKKCGKCRKTFKYKEDYERHRLNDHPTKCIICSQSFTSVNLVLTHIDSEHNISEGGTCVLCQKNFTSSSKFRIHAKLCLGAQSEKKTRTRNKIKESAADSFSHMRSKLNYIFENSSVLPFRLENRELQCLFCLAKFIRCDEFKHHATTEHMDLDRSSRMKAYKLLTPLLVDVTTIECRICRSHLGNLKLLIEHLGSTHEANLGSCGENLLPFKLINDRFLCSECNNEYDSFEPALCHLRSDHWQENNFCVYCGKLFYSKDSLSSHMYNFHGKVGGHKCLDCGLLLSTKYQLIKHVSVIHKKKIFKCSHCPESFSSYIEKVKHTTERHGGGFKCQHCEHTSPSTYALKQHVRKAHRIEINFKCQHCNFESSDKKDVKKHMINHVGEKVIDCKLCDKKFVSKRHLYSHMKMHERRKPFRCQYCDKEYRRRQVLEQHMNIHFPDKAFSCNYCDKKFVWKQNYVAHTKTHHAAPERPVYEPQQQRLEYKML